MEDQVRGHEDFAATATKKELENECARLKRMYANPALERQALKDVMKKICKPDAMQNVASGAATRSRVQRWSVMRWRNGRAQPDKTVLHSTWQAHSDVLIERFNRTLRTEVFDRFIFQALPEVRRMTEDWRQRYNYHRPHLALGGVSPIEYRMAHSHLSSTSGTIKRGRYKLKWRM